MPSSVLVPEGAIQESFPIETSAVAVKDVVRFWAETGEMLIGGALTLRPIRPKAAVLKPSSVVGGLPVLGRVNLECPAGPGPIEVLLASANPAVADVVQTPVVVPMGASGMPFDITTTPVTYTRTPTIKATANGTTKTKKLTVTPAP